jgi:2-iminobutanoate/2-iminopropanoate deaminase
MLPSRAAVCSLQAPAAIGPYSQAVRLDVGEAGGLIFCSGQIPLDPVTGELCCEDLGGQVRRCLQSLQAICGEAGAQLQDGLRLTVYTTELQHFETINEVYSSFFGPDPPARVVVGVAALPRGAKVEIDAIVLATPR